MKESILVRQSTYQTHIYEDMGQSEDYVLDEETTDYVFTQCQVKHSLKEAKTRKLNSAAYQNYRPTEKDIATHTRSFSKENSLDSTGSFDGEDTATAMENRHLSHMNTNVFTKVNKRNGRNTNRRYTEDSADNTQQNRRISLRKQSVVRIGNALREIQNTMSPTRKTSKQVDISKSTDLNSNGTTSNYNEKCHKKTNSNVERTQSLPNIKDQNIKRNGTGVKKNSVFRKLSRSNSNTTMKKSTTTLLDYNTADIISFPSNRLERYRTKSEDTILQSELDKINKRRLQGRSTSAQFTSDTMANDSSKKVTRERSFSTDCDQHLFSFDLLVARRLNSSRETQLCSTDL